MLRYMRNNVDDFKNLTAFEFRYNDDLLNTADALVGKIKYEFKSWTKGTEQPWKGFFDGTNNSYKQFKRYLQNSDNLDEIKYIFNGQKVNIDDLKNSFKVLLSNKADDLFKSTAQDGIGLNKMKVLFEFNNFKFSNASEFKGLLNNNKTFRNNVLKFIKSE